MSNPTSPPNSDFIPYVKRPSFVFSLAMLAAISAVAVDITLPAQPMIAMHYGERAATGGIIVSTYMIGYGIGQLFWGPMSDKIGRVIPLYWGLAGFIITSILCAYATSLEMLSIIRFVQGIFAGCSPVIARAITRDQGGGAETAKLLTTIMMIFGAAPLIAPVIGSGILLFTGWQDIFWFLAIFGVFLAVLAARFVAPSTRVCKGAPKKPLTWKLVRTLLKAGDFQMGTLVLSTIFTGYGAMLSIGALAVEHQYGINAKEFGPLFALAAVALIFAPMLTRFMIGRFGLRTPMKLGGLIIGIAGLAFFLLATVWVPLYIYWSFIFLYMASFGLIMPISNALALEPAGDAAGTASSLLSALPTLGAAAGSAFATSTFFASGYQALSYMLAAGGVSSCILVLLWNSGYRRTKSGD